MRRTVWRPVYLAIGFLFLYLPLLMVVLYSFSTSKISGVMTGFTLDWYTKLLKDAAIGKALRASLGVAGWSCALAAVFGTLGAVGMAQARFHGHGMLEGVTALPIMLPEVILGMSLMATFSFTKIPFGRVTLVIAHTTFCIPYVFILVKGRLAGLDPGYVEAARDLGARPARAFFTVTLPLILPAVFSGMLLSLAMSFDDVIISMFVNGAETTTLPLKIYSSLKAGVTPEINALCTLILGVISIAVVASQLLRGRRSTQTQQVEVDTHAI